MSLCMPFPFPMLLENFRRTYTIEGLKPCIGPEKGRTNLNRKQARTFQFDALLPAGQLPNVKARGRARRCMLRICTRFVNGDALSAPAQVLLLLFAARLGGQGWLLFQEHYLPASKGMKSGRAHLFCTLTIIPSFLRTAKALKINTKPEQNQTVNI